MKSIKRVIYSILAVIELQFATVSQRVVADYFAPLVSIPAFLFRIFGNVLELLKHLLTVGKRFKYPFYSIFLVFSVATSIATFIAGIFFPDLIEKLAAFEPIKTQVFREAVKNAGLRLMSIWGGITIVFSGILPDSTGQITYEPSLLTVFAPFVALIGIIILALFLLICAGAASVPVLTYIWIILLILAIFTAVSDLLRGYHSAWYEVFAEMCKSVKFTFWSLWMDWKWTVYLIPVINVILYIHWLKEDVQWGNYPPEFYPGTKKVNPRKFHANEVYSRLLKPDLFDMK